MIMNNQHRYILYTFVWLVLMCISKAKQKGNLIDIKEFLAKEQKANRKNIECPLKRVTLPSVHSTWLKDKKSEGTILCLLTYLKTNEKNGLAWTMLGSSYAENKQKTQSNSCFQQAYKLIGAHSSFIDQWHFIGPFTIGKSEFDGDPLTAFGGIYNVSKFRFDSPLPSYFSELAPKGKISWTTISQSKHNEFIHVRPQIEWNDLISSLSSMGITEWQGWLVGELVVTQSDLDLSFQCHGVAKCIVGNNTIFGDFYHREELWATASLTKGVHHVFIPIRSKVGTRFKFSVSKKSNFALISPSFLPDVYDGFFPRESFISFPISNLMTKKWLKIIKVVVNDYSGESNLGIDLLNNKHPIAPGQTMLLVGKVSSNEIQQGEKIISSCSDNHLKIMVKTSDGSKEMNLIIRCRKRGSSFLFTFLDHDGSVQHAAAIEPLGTCLSPKCPVVLTLHGTTVPPQNQADSYKNMIDGSYEFGVKNMWLLAPTRHGAHNWEGPGALTSMRALNALHEIVEASHWFTQKLDPWKILFAGHSMGGHGSLHLATHYPDRAIGLISLAGWISKEDYGDSNLFFRHDIANSHVEPAIKSIMESCVSENDADKHVSNLKDTPTLLRIGANDRTVHPYFLRRMLRLMKESGVDVVYSELPNLEHWWWDTKETNDGGCVNDAEIRSFMEKSYQSSLISLDSIDSCASDTQECERKKNKYSLTQAKQGIWEFVTFNPAFGEGFKGIRILQQSIPLRKSVIKMDVETGILRLNTKNVRCLKISESVPDPASRWPAKFDSIMLDDTELNLKLKENEYSWSFCRQNSQWVQVDVTYQLVRGPEQLGPARRVAEKSFVIIAGSQGNLTVTSIILNYAVYIANQFMLTSNTVAPIVKDSDLNGDEIAGDKNLIIIGGPQENLFTETYLNSINGLKLDMTKGQILLGNSCRFTAMHTGLMTLLPHGNNGLALLLMGLSLDGLADIIDLATPTIPPMARSPFSNLLPDYVITGPDKSLKGPGGFECIGFWDHEWRYSATSSSCVCDI